MMVFRDVVERLLNSLDGFFVKSFFTVTVEDDISVLPPWTGRTSKSIVLKLSCLRDIARSYSGKSRFRPVSFSVLYNSRGYPLYRRVGDSRGPISVSRGEQLWMTVSYYTRTQLVHACGVERVDLGYARFLVEPISIEVQRASSLSGEPPERIRIRLVTPLTITSKILAPDPGGDVWLEEKIKAAPERYRLLPTPAYIAGQLMRQWLALAGVDPGRSNIPKLVGGLADVFVAESSHRLQPVTVLYGGGESGERRVRGVVGWVELELLDEWFSPVFYKLLSMGEILGLGKSRSIGFGEIRVESVEKYSRH